MNTIHTNSDNSKVVLDVIKYKVPHLRKIPKKINWSKNNFERIFNPSKDEVLRKNNDKFVKWVMKTLKDTGQILKEKQNYNSCCLYLNKKNLDKLNDLLDPMVWLNFSPTTSTALNDDQLGIDLKNVVVDI